MKTNFRSAAIGIVAALGIAAVTARAAQHDQHAAGAANQHQVPQGQVNHSAMMERMHHCHEMMGPMMAHMQQMEQMQHGQMNRGQMNHNMGGAAAHQQTLAGLRQCQQLMGQMITHMQQMGRMQHRRR